VKASLGVVIPVAYKETQTTTHETFTKIFRDTGNTAADQPGMTPWPRSSQRVRLMIESTAAVPSPYQMMNATVDGSCNKMGKD